MIRINNDYSRGAHPEILKALYETNNNSYGGYGQDEISDEARQCIKNVIDCPDADIHFLVGGTQTNYLMIEAALTRPYQAIIAPNTGHICVHESGSVEHTGHKIHQLPSTNAKITAEQIAAEAEYHRSNRLKEHITEPKLVYISMPTEYGTVYTLDELKAIRKVCDEYGLYLYVDGARFGYGLASAKCDYDIKQFSKLVDAYYIGGTKCGLLFGEALVINNPELKPGIRNYMKLNGALLAKGWLLGLQYLTMFRNGLYFEITDRAVRLAEHLKKAFADRGYKMYITSDSNELFYIMDNDTIARLSENFYFEVMDPYDENSTIVRFCTSWATTQDEVDKLIAEL